MFTCNNLTLLTFTYYLKITLAICMTIIPFILFERMFISLIRYKQKYNKLDKIILKRELKSCFYIVVIFSLAFSLHTTIHKENNVCYNYATKEVLKEYKSIYKALQEEEISDNVKLMYLENVLLTSYNNLNTNQNMENTLNKEENKQPQIIKLENNIEEKKEDNFLKETNFNKLNTVYIKNGTFYYPRYISGNKSTYTGMYCPNDPLKQGFNNSYGYNNYFYIRLTKFIEEASKNGHKITFSTQGCRSYQTQVNYYYSMEKGRAIYPGYSMHGLGIASDLEFYQKNGSPCPYGRTDSSCPSMGWAHKNASRFGLTFPLLYASYREDWHIEPSHKVSY